MSNETASADPSLLEAIAEAIPAMTTSSAEPARLEGYPDVLAEADEQLTALARRLDRDLGAFAAGAGAYLPAGFDPAADGNLVRGWRDESRYLADWVARVGAGFRAADTDVDGDGIYSATDEDLDGLVGPATMTEAMTIPAAGTDPVMVAQWWATLPTNLRNRLIRDDYAQLGRLRGLPAEDTDRINRLRLRQDLRDLERRRPDLERRLADADSSFEMRRILAELTPVRRGLANATKILSQMAVLDEQHRADPAGHARPYLLTYGYQDNGRFAVALGNPDYADNTAVVVPGTGHDVNQEAGPFGPVGDGERLLGQMNAETGDTDNAVIVWMGADMPDDIPEAYNGTFGDREHGAAWLRDDVAGYQAAHAQAGAGYPPAPGDSHMTVVAHSYGSYLTGEALESGMEVDDFVSIGSAGLDIDDLEVLGMPSGHVWGGQAAGDPVPYVTPHGDGPTFMEETKTFTTDGSYGHSEYYEEAFFGGPSESLQNMARIAVGHYGDVETRPPFHRPPGRLPDVS